MRSGEAGAGRRLAVVIGASGGIGREFVVQLSADERYSAVIALARSPTSFASSNVHSIPIDITDEESVAAAAGATRARGEPVLVICATGILHHQTFQPERSWGALDAQSLSHVFQVNAVGPALVAKHFLELMPRGTRCVFAALSARVGSIGDNRRGGWYAYRASKAALNMLLKTYAVEISRKLPQAVCVGLHPGTVDTPLSRPFQRGLPPGQLLTPAQSVAHMRGVIDRLTVDDSGGVFAWDGARIPN